MPEILTNIGCEPGSKECGETRIKRQIQTVFGDGSDGSEPGNCWATCIAMVVGVPLSEVPNFMAMENHDEATQKWLADRGYSLSFWWRKPDKPVCIASGPAARGFQHVVVLERDAEGNETVHDPHPSEAGLIKEEGWYVIEKSEPCPSCLASESAARELRERAEKAEAEWDHWKARYEQEVKDGNARFAEMDDRCHHAEHDLVVTKDRADKSESECAALRERLDRAEGLLDMVARGCYQGCLGKMVSDIEAFLNATPTPTVSKTETVGIAPAPELTEEELTDLQSMDKHGFVTAVEGSHDDQQLSMLAYKGLALRTSRHGFAEYRLTPAGREAARLFADRQTATPATEGERVNEEVQKG